MKGMLQIKINMKMQRRMIENQELSYWIFSKILGAMFTMPKESMESRPSIVYEKMTNVRAIGTE